MPIFARIFSLIVLLVFFSTNFSSANASPEDPPPDGDSEESAYELLRKYRDKYGHPHVTEEEREEVRKHWTPERMESATPPEFRGAREIQHQPKGEFNEEEERKRTEQILKDTEKIAQLANKYESKPSNPEIENFFRDPPKPTKNLFQNSEGWRADLITNLKPGYAKTTGKIYSDAPDGTAKVCSGSVVDSPYGNVIITAAHCVHSGLTWDGPGDYHTNIVFAPGMQAGLPLGGTWIAVAPNVHPNWWSFDTGVNRNDYDIAFAIVPPLEDEDGNKTRLQETSGAQGFITDTNVEYKWPQMENISVLGYPESGYQRSDFNGLGMFRCTGNPENKWSTEIPPPLNHGDIKCDMGKGASGGPWIYNMDEDGNGTVIGLSSRGNMSPEGEYVSPNIYSPHLTERGTAQYLFVSTVMESEEYI